MQKITGTSGKGMLTASVLLGLMILSTIINTAESSISAVPNQYFEGSLALGATKEHSIFKTVIPAASSGVLSGVILGIGRAIGEAHNAKISINFISFLLLLNYIIMV